MLPARLPKTPRLSGRVPGRNLAPSHRCQPRAGPRQEPAGFVLEKTGWTRSWRKQRRRAPTIPGAGALGGTHATGPRRTRGFVERSIFAFAAAAHYFLPAL